MVDLNAPLKLSNNTSGIEFSEVQQFRQIWIWASLGFAISSVLFTFVYQLMSQNYLFSFTILTITGLLFLLLAVFVRKTHLHTKIDHTGISYRFFPFHFTYRHIAWEQVDEIYVREFNALVEYGGWGARYSSRGNAYIVSGKYGLQMELADDRHILVSTHCPIELERIILKLAYHYEVR